MLIPQSAVIAVGWQKLSSENEDVVPDYKFNSTARVRSLLGGASIRRNIRDSNAEVGNRYSRRCCQKSVGYGRLYETGLQECGFGRIPIPGELSLPIRPNIHSV